MSRYMTGTCEGFTAKRLLTTSVLLASRNHGRFERQSSEPMFLCVDVRRAELVATRFARHLPVKRSSRLLLDAFFTNSVFYELRLCDA